MIDDKMPTARPEKLSRTQKKFLKSMRKNRCHTQKACDDCGIRRIEFLGWIDERDVSRFSAKFLKRYEGVKQGLYDDLEAAMWENALDGGSVPMQIHMSKAKAPERGYGEQGVESLERLPVNLNINLNLDGYDPNEETG
jgi:hypothetical protein